MSARKPLPSNLPPRLLSDNQAAEYVGLSTASFLKLIPSRFPEPIIFTDKKGGVSRRVWDIQALDAAIDRLSGLEKVAAGNPDRERIRSAIDRRGKRAA